MPTVNDQQLIDRAVRLLGKSSAGRTGIETLMTDCAAAQLRLQAQVVRLRRRACQKQAEPSGSQSGEEALYGESAEAQGEKLGEEIDELTRRSDRLVCVIADLRKRLGELTARG